MLFKVLLFVNFCLLVRAEDVYHSRHPLCDSEEWSQCAVHSVKVEPCLHGPWFCTIIKDKTYTINVNFTPYFTAENLKLTVFNVDQNATSLVEMKHYKDACRDMLVCPLEEHIRHNVEIPLKVNDKHDGKVPLVLKLWSEDDKSKSCCFSFKVKVK